MRKLSLWIITAAFTTAVGIGAPSAFADSITVLDLFDEFREHAAQRNYALCRRQFRDLLQRNGVAHQRLRIFGRMYLA